MTTMTATGVVVTGGVDTHQDLHVAAALDQLGRVLGPSRSRPPSPATDSCWRGCVGTAASTRSASRAPAATAQPSRGTWLSTASR
jgi:formylmethanofuran dehydrogenase subunit A